MRLAIKLLLTAGMLAFIVWQVGDLRDVWVLIGRMSPAYVFLVLIVNTGDRALMAFKWAGLLRRRGASLSFFRGLMIYCSSMIWGMFLPSTVGADTIRAVATSRLGIESREVVASIILERMIGFLSALLLGLGALLLMSQVATFDPRFDLVWWFGGGILALGIIGFVASFSDGVSRALYSCLPERLHQTRVFKGVEGAVDAYKAYRNHKGSLGVFFGLTLIEQMFPIAAAWLIARGVGVDVGLPVIVAVMPLTLLVARIPVGFDGPGTFEATFVLLMSLCRVSAAEATAIAIIGRAIQIVSWVPWWLAHLIGGKASFAKAAL